MKPAFYRYVVTIILLVSGGGGHAGCTEPSAGSQPLKGTPVSPRVPAEWEPHESVWLAWPTYDSMQERPKEPLYREILTALAPHVHVDLIVATEAEAARVAAHLDQHRVPRRHITFRIVPAVMDIWVRDTGPVFVETGDGGLAGADFRFNSWGYEGHTSLYPWDTEALDQAVVELLGLPIIESPMISEGGALEVNGKNTMILTEAVAFQRNPDMTRSQIEAEYRRTLGIQKIIWLEEGIPEDDLSFWRGRGLPDDVYTALTVGGHTDELVRFVDADTVLLAEVTPEEAAQDPVSAEARERLEQAFATLRAATDQDGASLEIIRVPAATPIYETMGPDDATYTYLASLTFEDGSSIPPGEPITVLSAASYLNFFITNGVVLMPRFWVPGRPASVAAKDARMMEILQAAFPDREIVAINPEAITVGGGGMHCITQQQPAVSGGKSDPELRGR